MNPSRRRILLAFGMVVTLAFALWTRRGDLTAFDWSLDPWALAGAVVLLAVPGAVQAGTWLVALRRVGAGAGWRDALRVWARSWLLRYEPSGAVGFAYRVGARERLGATTPQVVAATAYEQLAAVAGGALAAPVGFVVAGLRPPLVAVVAGGLALLMMLALRPSLAGRFTRRWLEKSLRGRTLAALVGAHAVGWAATALGLSLIAHGVGAGDTATGVLLGTAALAWLAGVLVPLAPGGLGVRDATLVVGLTAWIGTAAATSFALSLRILGFAGELLTYVLVEALAAMPRLRRAPVASAPAVAAAG